mgnify:CR=1 FL=1
MLPSDATFWELHIAIQDSFGWQDYHLHQFTVGQARDRDAQRICIPHPDDQVFYNDPPPIDESRTKLSDYLSETQPKMTYVYDFGDNWEHVILLEKVLPFNKNDAYPQVIDGQRAGPWIARLLSVFAARQGASSQCLVVALAPATSTAKVPTHKRGASPYKIL